MLDDGFQDSHSFTGDFRSWTVSGVWSWNRGGIPIPSPGRIVTLYLTVSCLYYGIDR